MKTLLVIMGASGTGKDTVGDMLQIHSGATRLISTTTRPMRSGEINGVSYHFVSRGEMSQLNMLEQIEYAGNYYGFSKNSVDEAIKDSDKIFTVATLSGFQVLNKYFSSNANVQVIPVYLTATEETVKYRMSLRGDSKESILQRLRADPERVEHETKELLAMDINCTPIVISVDNLTPKELYDKVSQLYNK